MMRRASDSVSIATVCGEKMPTENLGNSHMFVLKTDLDVISHKRVLSL